MLVEICIAQYTVIDMCTVYVRELRGGGLDDFEKMRRGVGRRKRERKGRV